MFVSRARFNEVYKGMELVWTARIETVELEIKNLEIGVLSGFQGVTSHTLPESHSLNSCFLVLHTTAPDYESFKRSL